MSARLFLFVLYCLAMLGGVVATSYYAWSPFSDEQRTRHSGFYGPTHK